MNKSKAGRVVLGLAAAVALTVATAAPAIANSSNPTAYIPACGGTRTVSWTNSHLATPTNKTGAGTAVQNACGALNSVSIDGSYYQSAYAGSVYTIAPWWASQSNHGYGGFGGHLACC